MESGEKSRAERNSCFRLGGDDEDRGEKGADTRAVQLLLRPYLPTLVIRWPTLVSRRTTLILEADACQVVEQRRGRKRMRPSIAQRGGGLWISFDTNAPLHIPGHLTAEFHKHEYI